MDPMHNRPPRRRHRTFAGEVAERVKHKIALKIAMALLKLAVVAFFVLLLGVALLLFYVAQSL